MQVNPIRSDARRRLAERGGSAVTSLALAALLSLPASGLTAQTQTDQTPTPRNAPPYLLRAFELRAGTIQDLVLPQGQRVPFEVRVVLDGRPCTLALFPDSIRSPNFQVLVTDATGTHPVPAPEENTYRGTVLGAADSFVSATLDHGRLQAYFRTPSGGWAIQALSDVMPAAPLDQHIVYRLADVVQAPVTCGVPHRASVPPGGGAGPTGLQYCEIALDCDLPYYQRNGSSVSATVSAAEGMLHAVNAIYQADVEIRHQITAIVVRTTAVYVGPHACTLRDEMASIWMANHGNVPRDVAHLLSGSGTFSGVAGCTWGSLICRQDGINYGASRVVSSNMAQNIGVVAHELGHNWGADHCDASPPCHIMCSGLGGCAGVLNSFSPGERAAILAFKATTTCLAAAARILPNPNVYYRLTTMFQGPNLSLDIINDGINDRLIMGPTGAFVGQYWKFAPAPELPGAFRISSQWQGDGRVMDIINGGADNNQPILRPIATNTGQLWTLTGVPQHPGYVTLHTEFRGPHVVLEGAGGATGNRPVLTPFFPFTGQMWLLTPLFSLNAATTTSFGSGCLGRGGVPQVQTTNGTAPWVGENLTGEITNVPAAALPALIVGGRLATPIDLGIYNSPGCFIRVDPLSVLTLSPSGGRGPFTLALPRAIAMVGSVLSVQGVVIDPLRGAGDPLLAATQGLELRFGLR